MIRLKAETREALEKLTKEQRTTMQSHLVAMSKIAGMFLESVQGLGPGPVAEFLADEHRDLLDQINRMTELVGIAEAKLKSRLANIAEEDAAIRKQLAEL